MKCCSVAECEKGSYARGFCCMHYNRVRRGSVAFIQDGRSKHPLHVTHQGILQRCNNPTARDYYKYGGRGIKVCDRWTGITGFPNFVADMGDRPSPKHTVDRIDNDKNYSPDNCRWATKQEQTLNSRIRVNNVSGHTGVTWHKTQKVWQANIMRSGVLKYLGTFDSVQAAAKVYEDAALRYKNTGRL